MEFLTIMAQTQKRAATTSCESKQQRASVLSQQLTELAERINAGHSAFKGAYRSGVNYAIEVGKNLLAVKDALKHGELQPWIERHCKFSLAQARVYMKVATNAKQIGGVGSIREAVALLAQNDTADAPETESAARQSPTPPASEPTTADSREPEERSAPETLPACTANRATAPQRVEATPTDDDSSTTPEAPPNDGRGKPVTNRDLWGAFRSESHEEIIRLLRRAKSDAKALVGAPLGAFINFQEAEAMINNAISIFKFAAPFAPCPYCRAQGCKTCKKTGWVGKIIYDSAPPEFKDAV